MAKYLSTELCSDNQRSDTKSFTIINAKFKMHMWSHSNQDCWNEQYVVKLFRAVSIGMLFYCIRKVTCCKRLFTYALELLAPAIFYPFPIHLFVTIVFDLFLFTYLLIYIVKRIRPNQRQNIFAK